MKRATDTRSRREVVAQMLDYAANGSVFWTPEQLRTWFEGNDPASALERLVSWLDPAEGDPEDAAGAFWQAAAANLRDGRVRLPARTARSAQSSRGRGLARRRTAFI